MYGWMDMNERMNGALRDQLYKEEVNKWVATQRGCASGMTSGCMDGWVDGGMWTNEWTSER